MKDLAEQLLLTHHAAVQLVNRLAKAVLVARTPSPTDRRSVLLQLTPAGRDLIDTLATLHLEEVLRQGKEALVLVPEISLTPQTIARFKGRCENVAVLHSHLGDAERGGHWRKVAGGHVQVVVGARSAVFAPTRYEWRCATMSSSRTSRGTDAGASRKRFVRTPITQRCR